MPRIAGVTTAPKSRSSNAIAGARDWGQPPEVEVGSPAYVRVGKGFEPTESMLWQVYRGKCKSLDLPLVGRVIAFPEGQRFLSYTLEEGQHRLLKSSVVLHAVSTGREWHFRHSYQLLDAYLGTSGELIASYRDWRRLLLVVGEGETRNRFLPELVRGILEARSGSNLPTILLSSKPLSETIMRWKGWGDSQEADLTTVFSKYKEAKLGFSE